MDKSALERKLAEIKDLKACKYIGTQEAWEYLKWLDMLYENPIKITNDINKELERREAILYYRATPERLLGLIDKTLEISMDLDSKYEIPWGEFNKYIPDKPPIIEELMTSFPFLENYFENERIRNFFLSTFEKVQERGSDDNVFGMVGSYALLHREVRSKEMYHDMCFKITTTNWNEALSKETLRKIEALHRIFIYYNKISIYARLERMLRDRVDHKYENRVELAADFVTRYASFEEALAYLTELIPREKERLSKLRRMACPGSWKEKLATPLTPLSHHEILLSFLDAHKQTLKNLMSN